MGPPNRTAYPEVRGLLGCPLPGHTQTDGSGAEKGEDRRPPWPGSEPPWPAAQDLSRSQVRVKGTSARGCVSHVGVGGPRCNPGKLRPREGPAAAWGHPASSTWALQGFLRVTWQHPSEVGMAPMLLYRWGNRGSERSSSLLKVMQPGDRRHWQLFTSLSGLPWAQAITKPGDQRGPERQAERRLTDALPRQIT